MDKNDDDVHVSFITLLLLVQQYNFYNIINNSTFKDHLRVHIVQISERGREKKYFTSFFLSLLKKIQHVVLYIYKNYILTIACYQLIRKKRISVSLMRLY